MVWKDKAAVFGSVQQDRRPRQGGRVPSTIGQLHPTGRSEEPLLLRRKKKKKKTMSRWFPATRVLQCSLYAESPVLRLLPGLSLTAGMHKRKEKYFSFLEELQNMVRQAISTGPDQARRWKQSPCRVGVKQSEGITNGRIDMSEARSDKNEA